MRLSSAFRRPFPPKLAPINSAHRSLEIVILTRARLSSCLSHAESIKGVVTRMNQIVVGDNAGRLHFYAQNFSLLDPARKTVPSTMIPVHQDAVTQVMISPLIRFRSRRYSGMGLRSAYAMVCLEAPAFQNPYSRGFGSGGGVVDGVCRGIFLTMWMWIYSGHLCTGY